MTTNSFLVAGMILGYFLPFAIAKLRSLVVSDGILILNIFLGWTVIGWLAALIWSVSAQQKRLTKVQA